LVVPPSTARLVIPGGMCGNMGDEKRNLLSPVRKLGVWTARSCSYLESSHRTNFRGLFRRARLRELISRAYLAELIDPNSADKDILKTSQLIRHGRPQLRRRIQDIFNSSHKDVLNSSSARLPKTYSQDDLRMSYRDVSSVRPSDAYSGDICITSLLHL
jgi:hypothetical protein